MEFFRIRKYIPFMRHALVFNAISLITFIAAVYFLAMRGLHFSIEFTGGAVLETHTAQPAELGHIRSTLDALKLGDVQVQNFGTSHDVLVRLPVTGTGPTKQSDLVAKVFDTLCQSYGGHVETRTQTTPQGASVAKPSCVAAGAPAGRCAG